MLVVGYNLVQEKRVPIFPKEIIIALKICNRNFNDLNKKIFHKENLDNKYIK